MPYFNHAPEDDAEQKRYFASGAQDGGDWAPDSGDDAPDGDADGGDPGYDDAARDDPAYDDLDDEDLLTDEEKRAARQGRFRVAAGVGDFFGVIAGTVVILVLVALLVSLVNWVHADISQTFTLWQKGL